MLGTEEDPPELCVVDGPVAIRIEHRPVSHSPSFRAIAARVGPPRTTNKQASRHRCRTVATTPQPVLVRAGALSSRAGQVRYQMSGSDPSLTAMPTSHKASCNAVGLLQHVVLG